MEMKSMYTVADLAELRASGLLAPLMDWMTSHGIDPSRTSSITIGEGWTDAVQDVRDGAGNVQIDLEAGEVVTEVIRYATPTLPPIWKAVP
jgi:hypothetical protein